MGGETNTTTNTSCIILFLLFFLCSQGWMFDKKIIIKNITTILTMCLPIASSLSHSVPSSAGGTIRSFCCVRPRACCASRRADLFSFPSAAALLGFGSVRLSFFLPPRSFVMSVATLLSDPSVISAAGSICGQAWVQSHFCLLCAEVFLAWAEHGQFHRI